jgi:DNA-directed RNA polymerase specialized sigma24 family protein
MTPAIAQPETASDATLLGEYVASGSEDAFRILVERHLPLVHAAARRQVREAQLADDVTQAVFILLARKARSISNPALLTAWLLKVTH